MMKVLFAATLLGASCHAALANGPRRLRRAVHSVDELLTPLSGKDAQDEWWSDMDGFQRELDESISFSFSYSSFSFDHSPPASEPTAPKTPSPVAPSPAATTPPVMPSPVADPTNAPTPAVTAEPVTPAPFAPSTTAPVTEVDPTTPPTPSPTVATQTAPPTPDPTATPTTALTPIPSIAAETAPPTPVSVVAPTLPLTPIPAQTAPPTSDQFDGASSSCGMSDAERKSEIRTEVSYLSGTSQTGAPLLDDPSTPQGKAFTWITEVDERQLCPTDTTLFQRYVLAILYYSTTGDDWDHCSKDDTTCGQTPAGSVKSNFLSMVSECDWSGITCTSRGTVREVALGM